MKALPHDILVLCYRDELKTESLINPIANSPMTNPYASPNESREQEPSEQGTAFATDEARQKLHGTQFFIKCISIGSGIYAVFNVVRFVMFFVYYGDSNIWPLPGTVVIGELWRLISGFVYLVIATIAWRYASSIKRAALAKTLDLSETVGWQNSFWFSVFAYISLTVLVYIGMIVYGVAMGLRMRGMY